MTTPSEPKDEFEAHAPGGVYDRVTLREPVAKGDSRTLADDVAAGLHDRPHP
jgi:hypothetical protein